MSADSAVLHERRPSCEEPICDLGHTPAHVKDILSNQSHGPNSARMLLSISPSPASPSLPTENGVKSTVCPTAIPGILNIHNEGAFDWGWQSCLAYGCQSLVVVVDANSMTRIQVLDQHKHLVSHVKWARENYCHGPRQPYCLRLASADIRGSIIVWDVCKGTQQAQFSDSDGPICDMAWHWHQDATQDMLLVLHAASTFILWNASTGTIIWRRNFSRSDHLESFDLDPHQPSRVLFIASDGIWLLEDLSLLRAPKEELKKITWQANGKTEASPPRNSVFSKDPALLPISLTSNVKKRAARFLTRGSPVVSSGGTDDPNLVAEIFFHRSINDVLVAIYPRQIVLVSLRYMCPYRTIPIEKSSADILSVLPLRQMEAFFCLHANGSVSFRQPSTLRLEVVQQPESSRLLKQCKLHGFAMDPVSETRCSILASDGRLLIWTLQSPVASLLPLPCPTVTKPPPKLILTHLTTPLHASPSVLQARPRPPNCEADQLIAVGSSRGYVQLHNLTANEVEREYYIQNAAVQGLKWINEDLLLVFAYPTPATPSALVKSEVSIVNITTGAVRLVRKSAADESPIRAVKVSPTKDHFVITFKNGIPEVWSIADGRRLVWHRPRSVPQATAAEWVRVTGSLGGDDRGVTKQDLILFVDLNGLFQAFKVKGNIVHEDKTSVFATQTTIGHITAMCRKRNKIIMGDVDGCLIKWVPSESMAESKNLNRGWIRSIKFSPKERTMWAAVLFNDGLDVWEIETMELINKLKPKQYKVSSLDWVSTTHLALCCTDGIIRIFDFRNFHSCSSSMNRDLLPSRISNPYLLIAEDIWKRKANLLLARSIELAWTREKAADSSTVDFSRLLALNQMSTVDRCYIAATFMGDESDYNFWKACMRAFPCTKSLFKKTVGHSDSSFMLEKKALLKMHSDIANSALSSVSGNAGRIRCFRRCVQDLVAFGASDRAVEYLLDLDPHEEHYYEDCLKAALFTALENNPSESVQSTIKLVATNLIASSSFMTAGIELLCSIGKIGDACRYLQSSGNFAEAATLASLRMSGDEAREVYLKWIDHLCSPEINQKSFALLLCLHCGALDRALELMATSRNFERAAMFLRVCEEEGMLEEISERNPTICEAVFLEYARYLHGIGIREEALAYCDRPICGKNGSLLRQEFEILNHDSSGSLKTVHD